jgi:hypothetical protein
MVVKIIIKEHHVEILKHLHTITAMYMDGEMKIEVPAKLCGRK